jgi:hypothetical protein
MEWCIMFKMCRRKKAEKDKTSLVVLFKIKGSQYADNNILCFVNPGNLATIITFLTSS